jgi:hypothetical protein
MAQEKASFRVVYPQKRMGWMKIKKNNEVIASMLCEIKGKRCSIFHAEQKDKEMLEFVREYKVFPLLFMLEELLRKGIRVFEYERLPERAKRLMEYLCREKLLKPTTRKRLRIGKKERNGVSFAYTVKASKRWIKIVESRKRMAESAFPRKKTRFGLIRRFRRRIKRAKVK